MFEVKEAGSLSAAVATIRAAVDALASVDFTPASSAELTGALTELEVESIRFGSGVRRVVSETDQRGVAQERCAGSTADLLRDLLRINKGEANARVRAARDFGSRRALSGEALPPVVPVVAAALDTGEISMSHARVITKLLTDLPAEVEREHGIAVQEFLVDQARRLNPSQLADVAIRLADTLNPDGQEPRESDQQRRRDFRLIVAPDGSSEPSGRFTPELTSALRPVIDSLSQPKTTDGLRDDRTPGQRRHDGLLEAAMRLLRSGKLPESGGCPATILITVSDHDLATRSGFARDDYGAPMSISTMLRLAAEAELVPVILNATGAILNFGRARRFASAEQRRALAGRDKGCSFPGCTCPAAWTEAHHIKAWINGGLTDLNNLVLLCGFHHRHFESAGWIVRMVDDVPEWIPPAWMDEDRKPIGNTAHDTMELV